MSHCLSAMVAAKSAVRTPTPATTALATGARANSTLQRATRYTPAVTIVAAWIKAETGVGPCMASGSQTYKGIWADLPVQPRNRSSAIVVIAGASAGPAAATRGDTSPQSSEPLCRNIRNIATQEPKPPLRLTLHALLPASAF